MTLGAVNHVSLTVSDLARAETYYDPLLRFLGYRITGRRPGFLEWDGPGGWFILRQAREGSRAKPHDRYAPGLHHFAWNAGSRAEVEGFYAVLREAGATILDPPGEFPQHGDGYYAVFFADPDGIKLELAHTPVR